MTEPLQWLDDGTAFNPRYGDRYHSSHNHGLDQARGVFLAGNHLPAAWARQRQWRILETGFGCGLNFLVTWAAWRADPHRCQTLHFTSVEAHPVAAADIVRAAPPELAELAELLAAQFCHLLPGVHRLSFEGGRVLLNLLIGSVVPVLRAHTGQADSLYLDGFSPRVNAQMWSAQVFAAVARHCDLGTTLATWCVASDVRKALIQNGFVVEKIPGIPPKRSNLRGHYAPHWRQDGASKTAQPPRKMPFFALGDPSQMPQENSETSAILTASSPKVAQPTPKMPKIALGQNDCTPANQAPSVIIVGAGLAGAAAALSLARRGLRVLVLEAGCDVASGASGLPAGVFAPQVAGDDNPASRLSRAGVRLTVQRLRELSGTTGPLVYGRDWALTGVLERMSKDARALKNPIFFNELIDDFPSHLARTQDWIKAGFVDFGKSSNSKELENQTDLNAAIFHTQAGWVRPAALVRAQLTHANIEIRTQTRVARLQKDKNGKYQAIDLQGNILATAEQIIVAAGPASAALLPAPNAGQIRTKSMKNHENASKNTQKTPSEAQTPSAKKAVLNRGCPDTVDETVHDAAHACDWPLRPIRGQVLIGRWGPEQHHQISPIPLNGNGNFVPQIPDEKGDFWVMGSTFERNITALPPTSDDVAGARAWIAQKARALVPTPLVQAMREDLDGSGATWSAVRCTSSDRAPLAGAVGEAHSGVWTLTALGARGLTLSVLCGELLAAQMLDEPLPLEDALAARLDARRALPELPPA